MTIPPLIILLFVLIISIPIMRMIAKWAESQNPMSGFNKLIKQVMTNDNKDQVEQIITYHNNRVNAGADNQESYERMMRDLKRLVQEETDNLKEQLE